MSPSPERLARRALAWLATLLLVACAAQAQMGPLENLDAFPRDKLQIALGGDKTLTFDVWLASTPSRQAQGLMFVRSLPQMRGMLFVHPEPRPISMWMKNTYVPLDMVFIDSKGRIQQIAANAKPHSEDIIASDRPAKAVLEIGGGEARRLGLKPGQRVSHPALDGH